MASRYSKQQVRIHLFLTTFQNILKYSFTSFPNEYLILLFILLKAAYLLKVVDI